MGLLQKLRRETSQICLWNRPLGTSSAKKEALLAELPYCKEKIKPYELIYAGDTRKKATTNESSQVVESHGILIPGDSPANEEKIWATNPSLKKTRVLILGHHGSRTSTSNVLLQNLPNLKWAIATARKKRYNHPHPDTLKKLKARQIPVIKTEDWNSIIIDL